MRRQLPARGAVPGDPRPPRAVLAEGLVRMHAQMSAEDDSEVESTLSDPEWTEAEAGKRFESNHSRPSGVEQ